MNWESIINIDPTESAPNHFTVLDGISELCSRGQSSAFVKYLLEQEEMDTRRQGDLLMSVCDVLFMRRTPEDIQYLIDLVRFSSLPTYALKLLGNSAIDGLVNGMNHEDIRVRRQCWWLLRQKSYFTNRAYIKERVGDGNFRFSDMVLFIQSLAVE